MHSCVYANFYARASTKDLVPFERLGETVQLCNVYWPLEDVDKTDEIVTQLYLIIEALIPILYGTSDHLT